jgi:large-conductance mechanosensitive channel
VTERLAALARFVYDFVVGDDWRLAVGVVVGLALTALVAHETAASAWWVLPGVVAVMLLVSLGLAARRR